MKKILIVLVLLLASLASYSQLPKQNEAYYRDKFNAIMKGSKEVYLPSNRRRADIVTDTFAIEVEFANKFLESVGQALDYSMILNKKPAILLIVNGRNDENYLSELLEINNKYNFRFRIWLWDYATDKWCKVDQFYEYSYEFK